MMFPRRLIVAFLAVVLAASIAETQSAKVSVEAVGMTVSDMDRAVEFYSALTFQKVSDLEVFGDGFEHLEGVFGARMRIVRMKLGNEFLDLTQYLRRLAGQSPWIREATIFGFSTLPLSFGIWMRRSSDYAL